MTCTHVVLRALGGGVCPVCPDERARDALMAIAAKWNKPTGDVVRPVVEQTATAILPGESADVLSGASALSFITHEQVIAERCKRSLSYFVQVAWKIVLPATPLEWGPHLEAVCLHIQRQLEERAKTVADPEHKLLGQKLGINIPPRSGKTLIVQVFATAWAWIRWPALQILCMSANTTMLKQSAMQFREIINSDWYRANFATWTIREEQDATLDTGNTASGVRRARGFGSQVIGLGCDWMIIDDPHGADDSEREVQSALESWDTSLGNRINDARTTMMTLVMQRLREKDLSGHLKNVFTWLILPMEYEGEAPSSVYGWKDWRTTIGEVLHARFPPEYLAAEKLRLGSYGYAGQMQQRPAPLEGGRIKRAFWNFCRITDIPIGLHGRPAGCHDHDPYVIKRNKRGGLDVDWLALSLDPAVKKTDRGSLWGMLMMAGKDERVFVLDDRSTRGDTSDIKPILTSMILQWEPQRLIIEEAASWKAVVDWLTELCARGGIKDADGESVIVPVETIKPYGEWEQRVDAFLSTYEAGHVHLLDGAPWASAVVEEHAMFPNGENDDRIDALVQAIRRNKTHVPRRWMGWK